MNYDEVGVIKVLSNRKGISIDASRKVIEVVATESSIGNGTWGKINFLTKYCDYYCKHVDRNGDTVQKSNINTKSKNSNSILVDLVKSTMKSVAIF